MTNLRTSYHKDFFNWKYLLHVFCLNISLISRRAADCEKCGEFTNLGQFSTQNL